jgi:hypothetical protein
MKKKPPIPLHALQRIVKLARHRAEFVGVRELKRMEAEILILDPAVVPGALALLNDLDVEVTAHDDWVDECGPTVFFRVSVNTKLSEAEFLEWMLILVEHFGGDVIEAGEAVPPPMQA